MYFSGWDDPTSYNITPENVFVILFFRENTDFFIIFVKTGLKLFRREKLFFEKTGVSYTMTGCSQSEITGGNNGFFFAAGR